MISRFFLPLLLVAMTLGAVSCSEDKPSSEPQQEGVTLNMYDEKNGYTWLGSTDVYINASNNFRGFSYSLVDMGQKSGLGAIKFPELKLLVSEVAVQPGHGYLMLRDQDVREFKSGVQALAISSKYYKVYVDAAIERDGSTVGAMVTYSVVKPDSYGLPEFGTPLIWNFWEHDYLDVMLPTSDFEYDLESEGVIFEAEKQGRRLRIWCLQYANVDSYYDYQLALRIRGSYTLVTFRASF